MARKRQPAQCQIEMCGATVPNPCAVNISVKLCQADARKLMLGTHDVILTLRAIPQPRLCVTPSCHKVVTAPSILFCAEHTP